MCGIFGAVGTLPEGALDRVSSAIAHRGPDAEGRYVAGPLALLHRRLAILDLSPAGAQPMHSQDGELVLVFNGEIYNHHALRRELGEGDFRSRSDTEVILHGYRRWGDGVVERLDGMFAFGLWDRSRARLLLARDRAGKKPLYFSETGGVFRFGSTIEVLRQSGLRTALDPGHLPIYLAYGYVPAPASLHQGVHQLLPGELASYAGGQLDRRRYWQARFDPAPQPTGYAEARQRVRSLVTDAVERRLESDVPLGAFLSGGIDSSIIVGLMAQKLRPVPVRSFSIGFAGDPRYDETRYARLAAQAFGTQHTEFVLEPSSFQLVEELVRHHDGPFGDSSAIPTYVVSKLTREHVTVALTGDGGDELFCGYHRFLAAEAAEHLPLAIRRVSAELAGLLPASSSERTLLSRARRFLGAAAAPLDERVARWGAIFPAPRAILSPSLIAQLGDEVDEAAAWQRARFAEARSRSPLARVLEHNFNTYLPYDLLVKADRCSMAASLETRSPFLDTALIEYAQTLPAAYLRRGTNTKRILKDAFSDLIPEPIRRRGKMGFGVPLAAWFRGDLRSYLHDHLGPGARMDAYLSRPAIDRLLDEHARGVADHGHRLWTLLTLEIWLRQL